MLDFVRGANGSHDVKPKGRAAPGPRPGAKAAGVTLLLALLTIACISMGAGAASMQAHTAANAADYVILGNGQEQLPTALAAGHWDADNRSDVLVCSSLNRSCWLFLGRYA